MKDKKELETQMRAVRDFLATRTLWTSCLRDLSNCLPNDISLTSVRGVSALPSDRKTKGSRKNQKSFVLRGEIPLPDSGVTPDEIDTLIDALRADPEIHKEFPIIKVDELSHMSARVGRVPMAAFTIQCEPGTDGKKSGRSK